MGLGLYHIGFAVLLDAVFRKVDERLLKVPNLVRAGLGLVFERD